MNWQDYSQDNVPKRIDINGVELECRCWGPPPDKASTIVLLHEGLGSLGLWKDFPARLAELTGYGVFAYSRAGYGNSDPVKLPRPLDYMTGEAIDVLPVVLDSIGFRHGVLIGHSDGASIAAIYAGSLQDHRVRGLCLIAPHFFTEPQGLAAIAKARTAYDSGDLRQRLSRHHKDPDNAFNGWNDAWLAPGFKDWNIEENIAYLRAPVLAIQGKQDQFGTMAQIETLRSALYSPFDLEILEQCNHSPHIEQTGKTLASIADFLTRLDRMEAAE